MSWNSFDLNLLVVFDAITQAKSLTRAGRRLGMSQPAVRNAGVWGTHSRTICSCVRPPGHGSNFAGGRHGRTVHAALQELQVTVESDMFDPLVASRGFTIAANNYGARAVVPEPPAGWRNWRLQWSLR